jgi:hypothetical protein
MWLFLRVFTLEVKQLIKSTNGLNNKCIVRKKYYRALENQ